MARTAAPGVCYIRTRCNALQLSKLHILNERTCLFHSYKCFFDAHENKLALFRLHVSQRLRTQSWLRPTSANPTMTAT